MPISSNVHRTLDDCRKEQFPNCSVSRPFVFMWVIYIILKFKSYINFKIINMLVVTLLWKKNMSIFQHMKRFREKSGIEFHFLQTSFLSDLKETDGVSYQLLHSSCCDITHLVASSKCCCAFMRKWTQRITS